MLMLVQQIVLHILESYRYSHLRLIGYRVLGLRVFLFRVSGFNGYSL
jgi:hypothetical protein